MGPITIGVLGAATIVTGLAVVVEWKKCKEMRRLNDLMEMQMRAAGVDMPEAEREEHNGRMNRTVEGLLKRAGYTKAEPAEAL